MKQSAEGFEECCKHPQVGPRAEAPGEFSLFRPSFILQFGDQIHDCGRTFLFGKLTCKFPTACKMSKYGVFSGPYFPVFGLNTEIYFVNLQIRSECRKRGTRKKPVFGHFWHSSVLHVLQLLKCINPSSFQLDWQPMLSP